MNAAEDFGNETPRFVVIALSNGKNGVVDTTNEKRVGFGYNVPPLYRSDEWGNYYSARGFCQKLNQKQIEAAR